MRAKFVSNRDSITDKNSDSDWHYSYDTIRTFAAVETMMIFVIFYNPKYYEEMLGVVMKRQLPDQHVGVWYFDSHAIEKSYATVSRTHVRPATEKELFIAKLEGDRTYMDFSDHISLLGPAQ